MKNNKSFLKSLLGFSVGPIVAAALGFLTIPITTYLASPEDFGKASMYTMAFGLLSLVMYLGMDQAFVREFNVEKNKRKLLWSSFYIPFIFSILVSIILVIFYIPISNILFDGVELYMIIILAASLPFAIIDRFNMLIIRMKERALLYSIFNIANKVFNIIFLLIYLIFIDRSFKGIINATFISLVIISIIGVIVCREYWITTIKIDKKLTGKMIRYALPLIPASIIGWVFSSMDRMALRAWSDFNEIGIYAVAFKITTVLGVFQQAFATFWTPTAFRWYENGEKTEKFMKVSEYLTLVMTFVFILVVVFKNVILFFIGDNYDGASKLVAFLLFIPIMYTMSETTTLGIAFQRKTKYNILISLVVAVINFMLNFLLVPKLGALGACIATAVSYLVFFWMRTIISSYIWQKFNYKVYIVNTMLISVIAVIDLVFDNYLLNSVFIILFFVVNFKEVRQISIISKEFITNKFRKDERFL